MNEYRNEEDAVEVWDGSRCADDQAPGEAHDPVGHVILTFLVDDVICHLSGWGTTYWFTREPPPATCEKAIAASAMSGGGVLNVDGF